MANKSQRLTKQQWQALVPEQATSGLSREVFCKTRKLNKHTFCYWQQKLRSIALPASSKDAADFIEIKRPAVDEHCDAAWDVELALGKGITLRLRVS